MKGRPIHVKPYMLSPIGALYFPIYMAYLEKGNSDSEKRELRKKMGSSRAWIL